MNAQSERFDSGVNLRWCISSFGFALGETPAISITEIICAMMTCVPSNCS